MVPLYALISFVLICRPRITSIFLPALSYLHNVSLVGSVRYRMRTESPLGSLHAINWTCVTTQLATIQRRSTSQMIRNHAKKKLMEHPKWLPARIYAFLRPRSHWLRQGESTQFCAPHWIRKYVHAAEYWAFGWFYDKSDPDNIPSFKNHWPWAKRCWLVSLLCEFYFQIIDAGAYNLFKMQF